MNTVRSACAVFVIILLLIACNSGNSAQDAGSSSAQDTFYKGIPQKPALAISPLRAKAITKAYRDGWMDAPFTEYLLDLHAIDELMKPGSGAAGIRIYHAVRDSNNLIVVWPVDSTGADLAAPRTLYIGTFRNICPPNCDGLPCATCPTDHRLVPYTPEPSALAAIAWIQAYRPHFGDTICRGFTPDMSTVAKMRTTPGCTALRVYQALEGSRRCAVMAGADSAGRGIWRAGSIYKEEVTALCPAYCDVWGKLPPVVKWIKPVKKH